MTVLCDWEIRERCEQSQMVVPFNAELLNPASIDVVLGNFLMVETIYQKGLLRIEISKATEDDPFVLLPGNFCLAETSEIFNLPDDISAQFVLKSSRAREGYNHLLAGWCDPGWHGSRLTLELKNETKYTDLPLYPGLKIGQIVFHKMNNVPQASYAVTGNYNNHLTVMPSVA
jgi:dCTP deaminase